MTMPLPTSPPDRIDLTYCNEDSTTFTTFSSTADVSFSPAKFWDRTRGACLYRPRFRHVDLADVAGRVCRRDVLLPAVHHLVQKPQRPARVSEAATQAAGLGA